MQSTGLKQISQIALLLHLAKSSLSLESVNASGLTKPSVSANLHWDKLNYFLSYFMMERKEVSSMNSNFDKFLGLIGIVIAFITPFIIIGVF